ncbi:MULTISPECIES: membrane protein [Rubrivivax]|uniref:Energy-coupling factor transport system substrate-specific component n=1 Tax=Rubrivivax benzoatilyticus TaxID=316997 RepID=A0ABX0HVB6_9BURK|nr:MULTISPECIES: membrane protein [Rubrivivax]MCD0420622.1 hypothetical protein [Rubrivivax sp. JA1024]MCC9595694.1 hypothetical protein [Rubrivivax sp. JA1055]MCC9646799.1 hypothetical protein [Rubrivivax sp. JA1029]NHK97729.1 hypothetical protein [Rubrivivax benzoatilyticus]NHL23231.1 hypothetical protein [Rubrivivax benzoatilyticus]
MVWLETSLAAVAIAAALAMRPWRGVGPAGPPWPWLAWAAMLPLMWGADRYADSAVAQPLSGACLLMLMMGWPLAVLALVPVALVTMFAGGLTPEAGLERFVWLGLVPATMAVVLGAAVRRWLPKHLFVYILGRGFFVTAVAGALAGALAAALHPPPNGLGGDDLALARWLAAWGDAWLAGILVAIFVAFRPHWLATYTDRLYLPKV